MAQLHHRKATIAFLLTFPAAAIIAAACSAGDGPGKPGASGTGSGGTGAGGGLDASLAFDTGTEPGPVTLAPEKLCDPCNDFEVVDQPFIVEGAESAPGQFSPFDGTVGGGPCISDPPQGALFPYNWTRPRIRWQGAAGPYEVRISSAREAIDFVAYTSNTEFYIPRKIWFGDPETGTAGLAANSWAEDITVTVRAAGGGASQVTFQTAPVPAGGSLVYWVTTQESMANNDGWLMGFSVGDESSVDALRRDQILMTSYDQGGNQPKSNEQEKCIGCHTSTPDGNAVAYNDGWPWNGLISSVTPENAGAVPDYVSPGGQVMINLPWQGTMTFSPGDWATGARRVVTATSQVGDLTWQSVNPGNNNKTTATQLVWIDLATPRPSPEEAALLGTSTWQLQNLFPEFKGIAWGAIARNGDTRAAVTPDWSNGGDLIAYTSSTSAQDGRVGDMNDTDIYVVPFNGGQGGDARPLTGAAQTGPVEYYPNFSADDKLVAFNRLASATGTAAIYSREEGEIWIAPVADGTVRAAAGETEAGGAIRLRANDSHACSSEVSPGIYNSWAKWSPQVHHVAETGLTYYWLVFSSGRDAVNNFAVDHQNPEKDTRYVQLYMAPITVDADGNVTTYPAIYLWNQDRTTSNFTPAWDDFTIPDVPEVPEIY